MAFTFQDNGCLLPGIHIVHWDEFSGAFGFTEHRKYLLKGLQKGINQLKECGCNAIYVDGSFVTKKWIPNDFDSCWDHNGVDLKLLKVNYPLFFDFSESRKSQKEFYGGEFFPASFPAAPNPPLTYLEFFQLDRDGNPKGIIQII
jgi:hypothetical protein